jgi:hypothetical protein
LLPRYVAYRMFGVGDLHSVSQILVPRVLIQREFGMTSVHEQAYFEWYAAHIYSGRGAMVDLGSWLGSTTIPLARGLARNRIVRARTPIRAFDLFVWDEWMNNAVANTSLEGVFRPGDSFAYAFRERVARWKEYIEVHEADLTSTSWHEGPIELLLIDAMKSWELAESIVRNFYIALLKDGHLLHQDFAHWYTPWIHLIGYRLREYLKPQYDVPGSASFVFRVSHAFPPELASARFSQADFAPDEIVEAFEYSLSLVASDKRVGVLCAKAKALIEIGDVPQARRALSEAQAAGPDPQISLVAELFDSTRF